MPKDGPLGIRTRSAITLNAYSTVSTASPDPFLLARPTIRSAAGTSVADWITMLEAAIALIAIAETRHNGYVDVPPSEITLEIYEELIKCGLSLSRSDALWMDGWRLYSPLAVRAGLYREYTPQSTHTRMVSPDVRVPSIEEIEDMAQTDFSAQELNGMHDKSRMD